MRQNNSLNKSTVVSVSALKSKFKSSIESIKKFFNFGAAKGWKRLPPCQSESSDDANADDYFIESDSLIASYHSLPPASANNSGKTQVSETKQSGYKSQVPMRRITKELIDDEVPLITL